MPIKPMKKPKLLLLLLIPALVLIFSSCTKESEDSILLSAKTKMEEAKKLETENKLDEAKKSYLEAVEIYKKYLAEYPSSSKAPEVYSSIAKIYVDNLRDYPNAIKYYEELSKKFPATKESKYGMFMVAFIYDEMLKDKDKAKESYRKFLDKYPKDEDPNEKMSESARMMLQMLDENRSIEDIIKNTQKDTLKTEKKEPTGNKDTDTLKHPKLQKKDIDDGSVKVPPRDDKTKKTDIR